MSLIIPQRPASFYHALTKSWPLVTIASANHKGRGLFATRDVAAGTQLFAEVPAVTLRYERRKTPRYFNAIPIAQRPSAETESVTAIAGTLKPHRQHCAHCLAPLQVVVVDESGTLNASLINSPIVRAIAAEEFPYHRTDHQRCREFHVDGVNECPAVFCSQSCHDAATRSHHTAYHRLVDFLYFNTAETERRYKQLKHIQSLQHQTAGLENVLMSIILQIALGRSSKVSSETVDVDTDTTRQRPLYATAPPLPLIESLTHLCYHDYIDDATTYLEYIKPIVLGVDPSFNAAMISDNAEESSLSYWLSPRGFSRLMSVVGINAFHSAVDRPLLRLERGGADTDEVDVSLGETGTRLSCISIFTVASYMNHACTDSSNVAFDTPNFHSQARFVSRRNIRMGDELTWTYSNNDVELQSVYAVACECPRCTGVSTSMRRRQHSLTRRSKAPS